MWTPIPYAERLLTKTYFCDLCKKSYNKELGSFHCTCKQMDGITSIYTMNKKNKKKKRKLYKNNLNLKNHGIVLYVPWKIYPQLNYVKCVKRVLNHQKKKKQKKSNRQIYQNQNRLARKKIQKISLKLQIAFRHLLMIIMKESIRNKLKNLKKKFKLKKKRKK